MGGCLKIRKPPYTSAASVVFQLGGLRLALGWFRVGAGLASGWFRVDLGFGVWGWFWNGV